MHSHKNIRTTLLKLKIIWATLQQHINLPDSDIGMPRRISAVDELQPMGVVQGIQLHRAGENARRNFMVAGLFETRTEVVYGGYIFCNLGCAL